MSWRGRLKDGSLSESSEHVTLARWIDDHPIISRYWCHPPNERAREQERVRLVKYGVKPGVPDFLIFKPTVRYLGLAIELKSTSSKSSATRAQLDWLSRLRECGWRAEICHGAQEAIDLIQEVYRDSTR